MANNDLISRQALLDSYDLAHEGAPGSARKLIEDAPAVDAVPVVHGRWINEPPYLSVGGDYLKAQECSVCRSFYVSDGHKPYSNHNYCPYCGANMDGDKE